MKKIAIILAALTISMAAQAQKLVIGAKMPDLKGVQWITEPVPTNKSVYVDFYQSTNATCVQNLTKILALKEQYPTLKIVILTREDNDAVRNLTNITGPNVYIGYDADGKKYESFGVKFVPFSMIFDAKSTLMWQGNAKQLTDDYLKGL